MDCVLVGHTQGLLAVTRLNVHRCLLTTSGNREDATLSTEKDNGLTRDLSIMETETTHTACRS